MRRGTAGFSQRGQALPRQWLFAGEGFFVDRGKEDERNLPGAASFLRGMTGAADDRLPARASVDILSQGGGSGCGAAGKVNAIGSRFQGNFGRAIEQNPGRAPAAFRLLFPDGAGQGAGEAQQFWRPEVFFANLDVVHAAASPRLGQPEESIAALMFFLSQQPAVRDGAEKHILTIEGPGWHPVPIWDEQESQRFTSCAQCRSYDVRVVGSR